MSNEQKDKEQSNKLDQLLESNYDGIQEYDNDLPKWWRILFYLTIAFAIVYPFWAHMSSSVLPEEILAQQRAADAAAAPIVAKEERDEDLLTFVKDAAVVEKGKGIFAAKCQACHGEFGQGVIGPNLTDDYWIHGGRITQIKKVIETGVAEKGMIAWKGMLSNDEVNAVVAFVYALNGTNPKNPKPAQGDKFVRE